MVKGRIKVFDRGDIIRTSLNPTVGNELQGDLLPALVLSKREFNTLGLTLVAPITSGGNYSRIAGFTVSLIGAGLVTTGVVLTNAIRTLNLTNNLSLYCQPAYSNVNFVKFTKKQKVEICLL